MIRFITSDRFLGGIFFLCVVLAFIEGALRRDHAIGVILDCEMASFEEISSERGAITISDLDYVEAKCGGAR